MLVFLGTILWYGFVRYFSFACTIIDIGNGFDSDLFYNSTLLFAFPFAVIIISDCLCQQLLDRTRVIIICDCLCQQLLDRTRVIIICDCLCQQLLDRTRKVTNLI